MATKRSNGAELLRVIGPVSMSAGTMVGTVVVIGRKIAEYGVKGMAIVRRNALRARVAALEFSLAAVNRELKKVRKKQKAAEPKEETQPKQAKTKKAKAKPKGSSRPRKRPKPKAGVKTKAAVKAKKPQPRVAKAKIKKATAKPKRASRPRKHPKPKVGVKTKAAVKAKKSQLKLAGAGTLGGKSDKITTSTELKTKIHRLEGELDDLKYPPVELEDELFED
jgi:outer membrane biosynthesis protein TonB